jgi:type IV pilus assembly protein PilY1
MPRPLVNFLQNYTSFWSSGNMKGGIIVADAPTGSNYKTYVLGTAQNGAVHYALTLKTDTSKNVYPDSVAWTNTVTGATSSLAQAPVVTYKVTGSTNAGYANYITTVGTVSTVWVHEIGAGKTATSITLPFTAASELIFSNGFLYVGDTTGNVWKMPVDTTAALIAGSSNANIVNIGTTYTDQAVQYLGVYKINNVDYVWASGSTAITVFGYTGSPAAWHKLWESHIGGSGNWDATGSTYTAETAVSTTPTSTSIQQLPTGTTITARASIVKNALLLPVTVPNATDLCYGDGYYFLFSIDKGVKPIEKFYKVNSDTTKTLTTGNLYAGIGNTMQAALSTSSSGTVIQASANQTPAASSSVNSSSNVNGMGATYFNPNSTSGLISWREIAN